MFKADGSVSLEAGEPVKRFRKSAWGMARDDGEADHGGPCVVSSENGILSQIVEESFVLSKSSFFFALWQHFGGRLGGGSNKRQKNLDVGLFCNPYK